MIQFKREKRWAVAAIGLFLLNFPLLAIFDKKVLINGFPLLYLYLFLIWIGLIWITYRVTAK